MLSSNRHRGVTEFAQYVRNWITQNTTPSSNTRKVLRKKISGIMRAHVVHWRTEPILALYNRYFPS